MPSIADSAQAAVSQVVNAAGRAWETTAPYAKTALHYGFIPAIIVVGMTCTEPRPSLAQLLGPM
jgi:import receptor subunit TOM7